MFTLSAFADEISPDPQVQIDILKHCGVRHIEFRSILKTNVLALSDHQIDEFKSLLDRNGFKLSAIGSPIGKVRIDEPFEPHLEKFRRAIHLCKLFGTECTPERPVGALMVSSEGACAAYFSYVHRRAQPLVSGIATS